MSEPDDLLGALQKSVDEARRSTAASARARFLARIEHEYGYDSGDQSEVASDIRILLSCVADDQAELDRLRALLPPADLPPVLASVEDVARVAEEAGFVQAVEDPSYWKDEWDVLLDVIGEYDDEDDGLDEVSVQRSDDCDVATVHAGAPAALLWHAIQAARSAAHPDSGEQR